ncbi:ABC transporter ATP-binding protein [Mycoplasmopsis glycophila]|uniref:ABC transporter ATP-binding protein n=1 Tax=Mycoplasmopsis glycophila TaxID=171285 RepID=A0A449AVX4_9BACT|nr:ABC transporter ATP-binding protein [Mycoplasmopsis glycophila]VEU70783.1 ABC transporter ATP-binding protein [Mycoplasmopsis glycophila]
MNTILKIQNLSKIYTSNKKVKTGIFDLNFEIQKGEFHAFIGENGAGKTTTIKSIVGAYQNFEGSILINNISNKLPESKKFLGYVPENANFPKDITVYNYLYSLALLNNLTKKEIDAKIDYFLKSFEIEDLKNLKPFNFSSGQKKKILLIQALMFEPEIIVLDEPAANLDPTARYNLFKLLKELNEKGTTIFISSHVLSEIDKYVDSLTLIHKGKIVYTGKKQESLENIFYEKVIKN